MPQNADYTQEYFEILEGFDGDIAGRRAARAYMLASTAICHDEVVDSSFIPRLYSHETYLAFKNTAETIHRILCKVIEHYLQDPLYRSIFSFDERLVELILLPRGYPSLLPFARVDVFLDEDDLRVAFCEFNADGSSGMNEDREILASIAPSRSFKEFSRRHHVASSELFASWVDEFIRIYESYEFRVEKPRVAICDFLENAIIDEFHIYAGFFEARGIPCSIVDVRELRFDGQALRGPDGTAIDAIWRRSVTNDIIDHWDQSQELINALRARKVALIGSFAGHIVHDKQIFRALSNPLTQAFLTPEEISFLESTLPYTEFLDEAHIDLEMLRANKDLWLIKPTDHYGADQVHAGCYWDQALWEELIARFANSASGGPFLAQRYCRPYQTKTLPPDKNIESLRDEEVCSAAVLYNNLMGLYLYNGSFAGVFSRLGPLATICKNMQGITAATLWVDSDFPQALHVDVPENQ